MHKVKKERRVTEVKMAHKETKVTKEILGQVVFRESQESKVIEGKREKQVKLVLRVKKEAQENRAQLVRKEM